MLAQALADFGTYDSLNPANTAKIIASIRKQ